MIIQMRCLLERQLLRNCEQSVEPQIGKGFVNLLNTMRIQLGPARVRKFYKSSGGGLQSLQVSARQSQTLSFPFS